MNGTEVREQRMSLGLSQVDVIREAKGQLSQSALSQIESGESPVTGRSAIILAPILKVSASQLVTPRQGAPEGYMTVSQAARKSKTYDAAEVRGFCNAGRIEGAKVVKLNKRRSWIVPNGWESRLKPSRNQRIPHALKNTIATEYLKGVSATKLAEKHNIDQSYPSKLVSRGYPKADPRAS